MAAMTVACPACNKVFEVPARQEGESVECPECFEPFKARKPEGPKSTFVFHHGQLPEKRKGKKRKRRDDDDDYEHDHRRDNDDDDDDDHAPARERRRVYRGMRSPGAALTLGVLSLLFACVPFLGLILAILTLIGPSVPAYHPDDRPIVRVAKWLAWSVVTFTMLAVLAALGYFSK